MRHIGRPGLVLSCGLATVAGTAFVPAGLDGQGIPTLSWFSWIAVMAASIATLRFVSGSFTTGPRSLAWLLPTVVLLTLPAVVFAAEAWGGDVALALVFRSLAATSAGLATVTALGPSGVVAGLTALHVPQRLVQIVHAMLVSLCAITLQVSGMLRARAARRPSGAPWSALLVAPIQTVRGYGRLVGSLLLRSIERAESLERARRARGGVDS
jgi:energy-coupling factor transporter transmembrane protein EcfT